MTRPPRPGPAVRLLLRCYPRAFREAHAADLVEFWRAQAAEPRYQGARGRARLAAHLTRDAVGAGLRLRRAARHARQGRDGVAAEPTGTATRLRGLGTDLRQARRAFARAPVFAGMAVVTLGLGIGAATATFAVVQAVVLRPLPYPESSRLVRVTDASPEDPSQEVSWLAFRDLRDGASDAIALAAYTETESTFEWDGGAESIDGARVTHDFFDVMGVMPRLGRPFTADEDRRGGPDAIILSHGLWIGRFGGDPAVLGRRLPIDGRQVPVVGVMPEGFAAPQSDVAFWVPSQEEALLEQMGLPTGSRNLSFLSLVGRLRDGVALPVARERLREVARAMETAAGRPKADWVEPSVTPLLDDVVGDVRSMLVLILVAASLVLLVAALNVTGLALSRAAARRREFAVRAALGAGRGRLARQLLAESALVAGAAGVLGLVVAAGVESVLVRLAPPGLPRLDTIGLDGPTLAVAAAATLVSGLLFGLLPSIAAARVPTAGALAGARGASASRASLRPQQVLVALQVGVAVVLLTGGVLLTRSLARLTRVDLGFSPGPIVVASVDPGDTPYTTPAAIDAFYATVLERVRRLPGVTAASTTYSPPLAGNGFRTSVVPDPPVDGDSDPVWTGTVVVRDGYFAANGVPLLRGRDFDASDRLGDPPVAIVNETMARRLWPGEDPIGRRFRFAGGISGSAGSFDRAFFPKAPLTVVGVARDIRRDGLTEAPAAEYYRPHAQITWRFQYLIVRTNGDAAGGTLATALRDAVWSVDPTVPVREVRSLASYAADASAGPRFRTLLVGGFAALTCLLAMVGLYAVMELAVSRRLREVGIRLALGATRPTVVRGVLAGGLRLVALGLVAGLGAAWFASRAIAAMLFDLAPTDPATYIAVAVTTVAVAIIACAGPARRAGRVDPTRSLREG